MVSWKHIISCWVATATVDSLKGAVGQVFTCKTLNTHTKKAHRCAHRSAHLFHNQELSIDEENAVNAAYCVTMCRPVLSLCCKGLWWTRAGRETEQSERARVSQLKRIYFCRCNSASAQQGSLLFFRQSTGMCRKTFGFGLAYTEIMLLFLHLDLCVFVCSQGIICIWWSHKQPQTGWLRR